MKVILLQNIRGLGKKYDNKEVADGYAANYLIPNGLVKIADRKILEWAKKQRETVAAESAQELEKIGQMARKMEGLEVEVTVKVGDKGQLFEKVNPQKIVSRLKEMGYEVAKEQVELSRKIEEAGEFDAKIVFEHNLEAPIKIIVAPAQ
ncbi:MAG: 50S ribosomal protein L9 [Candidatus Pacebacteria bacterium]|nr:50S ribosomal protein L9 [Candidatus Paceibacterota bacterium]